MTDYADISSSSVDSSLASSMPASPTASEASSTSSVDATSHTTSHAGTPTAKHGRNVNAPASQSWARWLSDKYTIQYAIPPAYAPAALQISNTVFPLGVLFGLVLPRVLSFLLRTLTLSASSTDSPVTGETKWYAFPQLSIYLLSWVLFHMLEFSVTAAYNPTRLFSDSFLLNNGVHYHIAHLGSLIEFCLTAHLYPASKGVWIGTYVGLALIVAGQTLRSLAMIHAHNNFSHVLAYHKRNDHELVTTGVYAWTRHPSYVGFTYWALGTQVMLGNKLSMLGFVGVLWLFFSRRIRAEEKALVEFFGDKYIQYRAKVGTGLPFIR